MKSYQILHITWMFLLGSCAALNAVTLPETKGDASRNLRLSQGSCIALQERASAVPLTESVPIIFDALASSFKSYLQKKSSRFTATYAARATFDSFYSGKCLRLQRLSVDGDTSLLDVVLEIRSRGPYSIELSPIYLNIIAFAASTSPVEGKDSATVSISVALSFVNGSPETVPTLLSELTIPVASAIYTINSSPTNIMQSQASKLVPRVGNRAVNVAISITEVGRGAEILGDALSGFDANADALKSVLGIDS